MRTGERVTIQHDFHTDLRCCHGERGSSQHLAQSLRLQRQPARRRCRDDRRKIVRHQTHELVRAISELGWLNGVRPRVAESGLGLIPMHAYSAPYEDLKLKAN